MCICRHGCVTLLNVVCLQMSHPTQCFRGMHACKHVLPCIPVTAEPSVCLGVCTDLREGSRVFVNLERGKW